MIGILTDSYAPTGMAVAIDLGDPEAPAGDVHSRLKEQVLNYVPPFLMLR